MAKLDKMRAQAIISKLGRESNILRNQLIEEEKKNYTSSGNAVKLIALANKRDKLKEAADRVAEEARKLAETIGVSGFYNYTKVDNAILTKIRDLEIDKKYPKIDLSAALDDLIIESVEDNFDVNSFIESYIKKLRNE